MAKNKKQKNSSPIKVIPLGGIGEIGINITCIEYEDQILVVDCGLGFPDEDMLGIDLVIPDTTYLENNADKILGIVLTHGHEDHIGALPYVLRVLNVPVYGTRLTLGILEGKLCEHGIEDSTQTHCVRHGDVLKLGKFAVEFVRVNHSIADASALLISTPSGNIVFSGDFKVDLTPLAGEPTDLTRLGEIGKAGVLALFCESTNAERPGYTPSEQSVGESLDNIFNGCDKRIIIATFSSNVHRVAQIIKTSHKYGRRVAVTGRSMLNILKVAIDLGYMDVPEGTLIDINEIKRYRPEEITLITTGSQGEPMSALYRMAYSDHDKVSVSEKDLVVISATAIPGNEKLVTKIINELMKKGVTVLDDAVADVHVSGHACQEELKLMHVLLRPRYFVPIHGEYRHLAKHKEIARLLGMPENRILIPETGRPIIITEEKLSTGEPVPCGKVLVDGFGVGDVGNIVLRDRRHLGLDGLIVAVCVVDKTSLDIISGPEIVSRGFVYVRESEELMEEVRSLCEGVLLRCFEKGEDDWNHVKQRIKDEITSFLYQKTKRKPMILPVIMAV